MIEGKLIKYQGKKAYIGFAKVPLIPNDNGIGFKGVKLQTEKRDLIQCSECGEWKKRITSRHLMLHGTTVLEYKKKFGFNLQTSLTSDTSSLISSNNMLGLKHSFTNNKSIQRKGTEKLEEHWKKRKARPISIEEKNKLGTCSEQIKQRMRSFIIRFKRLPSPSGIGADGMALWSLLRHRYGKVNKGLRELDLPQRIQRGSHVDYVFPDNVIIKCGMQHNNYDKLIEKIKKESKLFN